MLEISLVHIVALLAVDIALGATALTYSVLANRRTAKRVERVESHLNLPPFVAVEEK